MVRPNTALRRLRLLAVAVALAALGPSVLPVVGATGASLGAWTAASAPVPLGSWFGVAYGDGRWVVVGHTSNVAVSLDGFTWTEYPVPAGSWQTVTYGDGRFVALSSAGTGLNEMTSSDGINWTATSGPAGEWTGLTYGGGRFVAVDSLGHIVTSTDGANWTVRFSHSKAHFTSVAYGNGRYVAVDGALGATVVSPNGTGWSYYPTPVPGAQWGAVAFGNGNFVTFDSSGLGEVATSVLGYVWSAHHLTPAQGILGATFGCGAFVADGHAASASDDFFSSPTGASWTADTDADGADLANRGGVGLDGRRLRRATLCRRRQRGRHRLDAGRGPVHVDAADVAPAGLGQRPHRRGLDLHAPAVEGRGSAHQRVPGDDHRRPRD